MKYDKDQQQDLAVMGDGFTPVEGEMKEWIQTYTGLRFDLRNPTVEMLNTLDIAHSLSNLCRYTGHTRIFYSVAEHSILLSRHAFPENDYSDKFCRTLLLHDAAEAYIGDISRPFKSLLPRVRAIEENIQALLADKYDTYWPLPREVKELDGRMLLDEKAILMHETGGWSVEHMKPIGGMPIVGWTPERAEREFLLRAAELGVIV